MLLIVLFVVIFDVDVKGTGQTALGAFLYWLSRIALTNTHMDVPLVGATRYGSH